MKKVFQLTAVAMMALLSMSSCEKKEPTAILPENLNSNVTICGYVRWYGYDENGFLEKGIIADQGTQVTILRGEANSKGEIENTVSYVNTNTDGFFTATIGVAAGQTIDQVEVKASCFSGDSKCSASTYVCNEKGKWVPGDAYFYGSKLITNMVSGRAYQMDIDMMPVATTEGPGYIVNK